MTTDIPAPESAAPAPKPKKKRGFLKFAVLLLLLLGGLLAAAPSLVSRFGVEPLEQALSDALEADVEVGGISFGWGGNAELTGLRIVDKQGFEHLSAESFQGKIKPLAAIRGSYEVEGQVVGLRMQADQDEEGAWSFARLFPATSPSTEPEPEGDAEPAGDPPPVQAKLVMDDAVVTITTPKGTRRLAIGDGRLDLPALDELGTLTVEGQIDDGADQSEPLRMDGKLLPWAALDPESQSEPLARLQTRIGGTPDAAAGADAFRMETVLDLRGGWKGSNLDLEADMAAMGQMIAPFLWDWAPDAGRMHLEATLGDEAAGSTFSMRIEGARATTKMAPALAYAHPIFAGLDQIKGAQLAGGLGVELNFQVPGAADVQAWMENPPLDRLAGGGSLSLSGLSLSGAQVLDKLYGLLGVTDKQLDLSTLAFSLDAGKLNYKKPWTWNMLGSPTTFGGAVGLDGNLDLVWKLPITDALASKSSLFKDAVGRTLELPLRGNLLSPEMPWKQAVTDLAKSTLEDKARQELTDKVGAEVGDKLDELIGDGAVDKVNDLLDKGGLGGLTNGLKLPKNGEKAAKMLLEEADKLWNAGKKAEAAPLYARIRDDYKLTTVYAFNRSRIKSRKDG